MDKIYGGLEDVSQAKGKRKLIFLWGAKIIFIPRQVSFADCELELKPKR